jgi:hypothetical protein
MEVTRKREREEERGRERLGWNSMEMDWLFSSILFYISYVPYDVLCSLLATQ